jgi:apolipoprotein D and lipocalin family protein
MIKHLFFSFLCFFSYAVGETFSADAPFEEHPFKSVPHVDLDRYMGTWYLISRLEFPWDRACFHNPIAIYTKKADGTIHVFNQCQMDNFFNTVQKAEGTVEVVDTKTNSQLNVSYPESKRYKGIPIGDYWIIVLADDYSYAAVSEPTKQHLWIYSRKRDLPQDTYQSILDKVVLMMPELNVLNVLKTKQDP